MDDRMDAVLRGLERQERRERDDPGSVPGRQKMMAITRDIGKMYNVMLRAAGASRVLEIGTSVGYSAIWFAEAVAAAAGGGGGGSVTTIEAEEAKVRRARANLDRAGVGRIVEIVHGDALDALGRIAGEPGSAGRFDFAFIDADKERSIEYFDAVLPLVRRGGLIGVDNVLRPERFAEHMRPLVGHAMECAEVRAVVVPLDNGELVCARL